MNPQPQAARIQAVEEELERTKQELRETLEIKAEAEASGDQGLIAEVQESETRQKEFLSELEAELVKLRKPASNTESLRARLQKQRDRGAAARNVLTGSASMESQEAVASPHAAPTPAQPSASGAPVKPPTSTQETANLQGTPKTSARRPITSQQEDKLIGEFAGLGGPSGNPSLAFASSSIPFDNKQLNLATAPSAASQVSNVSVLNHPPKSASAQSLDSFGASAFGRPASAKSTVRSSPTNSLSHQPESAYRLSDGSESVKNVPKDDLGFGESTFSSGPSSAPGPPTFKQWGGNQQAIGGEQGRGVSFKDSFPTTAAQRTGDPGSASQWQAFDVPSQRTGAPDFGLQPPFAGNQKQQDIQPESFGGFGESDFGASAFPSQELKPASSARSGNPFADGEDASDIAPLPTSYTGPPSQNAWQGGIGDPSRSAESTSDYGFPSAASRGSQASPFPQQGFGSVPSNTSVPITNTFQGSMQGPSVSGEFDPFGGPPPFQQPQTHLHQDVFSHAFAGKQLPTTKPPGVDSHNKRFGHAGQPFLVTPSAVVIPDADWDAAFSPAPAAAAAQPQPTAATEETLDLSVWTPMGEGDREKVRVAYADRYQAQNTNGISIDSARDLYNRGQLKQPMEQIFALADLDGNGRLNYPEFLIYMHILRLLNAKQDAVVLPPRFTPDMASAIIGTDYTQLPTLVNKEPDEVATPEVPTPAKSELRPVGSEQKIRTLVSRGSSQEDAKRALFLNGDDLDAATRWLETRKPFSPKDKSNLGTFPDTPSAQSGPAGEGAEGSRISLRIDKAVVNYKKPVDRPVFAVTIVNSWGDPVGEPITTPPGEFDSSSGTFTFGHTVVLAETIDKIPDDACVYFELKHFKTKEKKWSTLGWTYRHKVSFVKVVDSVRCVRTEAQGLNLYEKPIDLRSHFRQASMRKMKPLSSAGPDFYLRVSEA